MRVIAAPDSFKGSLSAAQAADAIAAGVLAATPDAEVVNLPLADGGEGTVDALVNATCGSIFRERVRGPLGEAVDAAFGVLGDGETAVIEMAAASGLGLVPPELRNPLLTTTYGTGQLLLAAISRGAKRVIVGVGGSATNDGGAGAMQALGARLLDAQGRELPPGGAALIDLARIDVSDFSLRGSGIDVLVACDVDNPLVGPQGASHIYGPQKGATPEMIALLDRALINYAEVIHRDLDIDIVALAGAGAGGGLAGGLVAFLDAELRPGIEIVLEAVRFDEYVRSADLIITGEGRIDEQTLRGKTIAGVLRRALPRGAPVVALAGCIGGGADALYDAGLVGLFSILDCPMTEAEAVQRAAELLTNSSRSVASVFFASDKLR